MTFVFAPKILSLNLLTTFLFMKFSEVPESNKQSSFTFFEKAVTTVGFQEHGALARTAKEF